MLDVENLEKWEDVHQVTCPEFVPHFSYKNVCLLLFITRLSRSCVCEQWEWPQPTLDILSTVIKAHLFAEHNWNLLVSLHLCLCATRLDALEWRCLYFPSGHNKQATKFNIRSHVLWKSISSLGSVMNKNVWISDKWITRLTVSLLIFGSPAGRSRRCFADEDLRGFHSPHRWGPKAFSKLPGGYQ